MDFDFGWKVEEVLGLKFMKCSHHFKVFKLFRLCHNICLIVFTAQVQNCFKMRVGWGNGRDGWERDFCRIDNFMIVINKGIIGFPLSYQTAVQSNKKKQNRACKAHLSFLVFEIIKISCTEMFLMPFILPAGNLWVAYRSNIVSK